MILLKEKYVALTHWSLSLKGSIAAKEVEREKEKEREQRKHQEKEETTKNLLWITKKKFEIDEANTRSIAMKVELAILTEETRIMTADLSIMDPTKRAWFEKKQKLTSDQDT